MALAFCYKDILEKVTMQRTREFTALFVTETTQFNKCKNLPISNDPEQRGLMLRMRIIVLEIAANCVKFIRNAGKRVRAAVAQTGLSFIECSLFVSKRTAQNECKAGI